MALARKGARTIDVDGVKYLWKLPKPRSYNQEGWLGFHVVVQHEDRRGSVLFLYFPEQHPTVASKLRSEVVSILPSQVAAGIRKAIADGWLPRSPGSRYDLDAPGAEKDG
ncbi:hypothetical protein [uncultured Rubinisphaera sp.]|uniref:hypothetical protein n=1 Tax=uncultured Rubinisphaera sp. TaxID=1678686 RepID=UPI0030D92C68